MALLQPDHALELCSDIVSKSPADQTEVRLECIEDRFVRFADVGPTQDADRERYDLSIRVRLAPADGARGPFGGWREAAASCGNLDRDSIQAALERALTLAEVADANPELVPLAGAAQVRGTAVERPTQDHTFREKVEWVERALAACEERDLKPAGLAQTTVSTRTLVNSAGRAVHGARSRASFALTASSDGGEGGAGQAHAAAANVERIDAGAVVRAAVDRAVQSRAPIAIDPGDYTVVLMPQAVGALLSFAARCGLGAREVHERTSFLCGRIGERTFPTSLTLLDDAHCELYPGYPFDGEGTPRKRVALLEGGALRGPVTDERWGRKLGLGNTGHAQPQPSTEGPAPENLVLSAGRDSVEQLVTGVRRGLLVHQFHYTNVIDPRELTLTGMTRNGTFLIEDGRRAHAVKNLRFTHGLLDALRHVTGVGNRLEVVGELFGDELVCPALRIDGFRFTSTTEF